MVINAVAPSPVETDMLETIPLGLNKESVSLDEIAGKYYKENGFVFSEYKELDL